MKKLKYLVASIPFLMPAIAWAQNNGTEVGRGLGSSKLQNLFGTSIFQQQSLGDLIISVIQILLFFAGLVAVVFIIIGGYFYITSAGNEEQSEKGKKTLINAIIGIVIIVLSYTIVTVLQSTIVGF